MMLSERQRAQSLAATQRRVPDTYRIDGETVTMAQMAERLELPVDTVRNRYKREAQRRGPVTWAGLAR